MERDEAIRRIKAGLKSRSGKAWSVRGGRGTSWGWITIDAPPARRTWRQVETGQTDPTTGWPVYEWQDTGKPGGMMGPPEREELAKLLGIESVHCQGHSIPASTDYRIEIVDRAEGRTPAVIGQPYWD